MELEIYSLAISLSSLRFADLLLGLGLSNLILGGIVLFSRANTALIKLARPADPSQWPILGFTEPMYTPSAPKISPTAEVSIGSPTEVPVP